MRCRSGSIRVMMARGGIGEGIEGADAHRIGEVADDVEDVGLGRGAREPVGAVGHQQWPLACSELVERLPARGRRLAQ